MVEKLYTLKEAGTLLSRSRSGIYLLLGRRELAAIKIGAKTVIRESELRRFLDTAPAAVVTARRDAQGGDRAAA